MCIKNKMMGLLLLAVSATACKQATSTDKSKTLNTLKALAPAINSHTKAVIVVDDNACLSCNQAFAGIISKYLGRKDVMFIISANPNKVDISPFIAPGLHNVYNDYGKKLFSDKIITASTVFLLRGNVIDTSITMNPESVREVEGFLENAIGK